MRLITVQAYFATMQSTWNMQLHVWLFTHFCSTCLPKTFGQKQGTKVNKSESLSQVCLVVSSKHLCFVKMGRNIYQVFDVSHKLVLTQSIICLIFVHVCIIIIYNNRINY